jgi:hypothetical protein
VSNVDVYTKIAALVSELGRLRSSIRTLPTDADTAPIRQLVNAHDAEDALSVVLACVYETAAKPAAPLLAFVETVANMLAVMHKDADKRRVTPAEILRMCADHLDDKATSRTKATDEIVDLIKKALGVDVDVSVVRVPKPGDSGDDKPGSN